MLLDGNGSSQQLKIAWDHIGDNFAREGQWRQVREPGSLAPAYIMTLHHSLKEIRQHAMHAAVSIMLVILCQGEDCIRLPLREVKPELVRGEHRAVPAGCRCCADMRVLRQSRE